MPGIPVQPPLAAVKETIARLSAFEFVVIAYCFMPDHLHLLVEGHRDDADLRRFITRAKQFSGYHFKRETGKRLWQRYGFERVLRDEESTPTVARYIINNPVRGGLVRTPADYAHWGSLTYTREQLLDYVERAG